MTGHRLLSTLALAAIVVAPLGAFAQAAPPAQTAPNAMTGTPRHHHHHHHAFMRSLRTLSLTDAQKAQIKDIAKSTRAANEGADRATRKANGEKMRASVLGVLTPDQKIQLQTAMSKAKAQTPERK